MKKILITAFILIVSTNLFYSNCYSQEKDTLKVLFIGNSYTFSKNLPQVVSIVSDYTNTKIIAESSTKGGAKLIQHWEEFRGLKSKEMIKNGHYDIVVIQEFSMGAINFPDSTLYYGGLLCDYAKKYGAKPYLFLTWARKKVPQYQSQINKIYYQLAEEHDATVVPVGKGWELAQHLRPSVELFVEDGSHPNYLGNFISATMFVEELTGEKLKDLPQSYGINDCNGNWISLFYLNYLDIDFSIKIAEQVISE